MPVPIAQPVDWRGRNEPSDKAIHTLVSKTDPHIDRNVVLQCTGDWGHANFHFLMSFITQEFTERCGPQSKTIIHSVGGGGMELTDNVVSGLTDIAIHTPVLLAKNALTGEGLFQSRGPAPFLRGIATLPQDDRMLLALAPSVGCGTYAELREKKPKLKLLIGSEWTSPIGYVAHRLLEAHGVSVETIKSWGGEVVYADRPEECLVPCQNPDFGFNAVINEAAMTPWWTDLIDGPPNFIPIPAEPDALGIAEKIIPGLPASTIKAGYWKSLKEDIPALEFVDFILLCREDLPDDVAYLITWILVTKKAKIEANYHQYGQEKTPLGWPLDPRKMAQTVYPLHPGAERFYREHGYL